MVHAKSTCRVAECVRQKLRSASQMREVLSLPVMSVGVYVSVVICQSYVTVCRSKSLIRWAWSRCLNARRCTSCLIASALYRTSCEITFVNCLFILLLYSVLNTVVWLTGMASGLYTVSSHHPGTFSLEHGPTQSGFRKWTVCLSVCLSLSLSVLMAIFHVDLD